MPMLNNAAAQFFTLPFRRKKQRYTINPPDSTYNVVYLGNVLTVIAGGENCFEKPLSLIWKAYCNRSGADLSMGLEITRSGLKAETKEQGLTEYWAHRITSSAALPHYPKVFCWIYKHDGKRLKPELRCHAVLCKRSSDPYTMHTKLQEFLHAALQEYRREKLAVQNARLTGMTGCPQRKKLLHSGSLNFRPPVCRSKSAPRLGSIDEEQEVESDKESVCYQAAPEATRSVSDASSNEPSTDFSLEASEDSSGNSTDLVNGYLEEVQCQKRQNSCEFDSISDESGYHEDKLLRGLSEESYYSDSELVMLEEDYEDREQQMTSL
ncbi:unnamed protein product [Nippostrongylus brasiliensis]|uniref:PID domain-containing protein n=1 Tax=Nippostrongylus brasiliensis TaxID=27835 RepID=A0A0N4XSY8_NIPBR|nr:hypothetical protein Q1695_000420 [Nippostrongylus brasiliensis]VDL69243.1 unnamed protein product [Nippostrongylus brasiliensis]